MKKIINLIEKGKDKELLSIYHAIAYKRFFLNVISLVLVVIGSSIYLENEENVIFFIISLVLSLIIMIVTLRGYSIGSRKLIGEYFKKKFATPSERNNTSLKLRYYISKAEKEINGKDGNYAFESFVDCLGIIIFVMNYIINLIVFLVVEVMLIMLWLFGVIIGGLISLIAPNFGRIIMNKAGDLGKVVVNGIASLYFKAFTTKNENVLSGIKSDIEEYKYKHSPETMSDTYAEPYLTNYVSLGYISIPSYVRWRSTPQLSAVGSNISVKGEIEIDLETITVFGENEILNNIEKQIERNLEVGINRYHEKYVNAKKVTIDIEIDVYR